MGRLLWERILYHIKLIGVDHRGLPVGIRSLEMPVIVCMDMAVEEKFRFIFFQQGAKCGKTLMGEIGEVVEAGGGGVGDENVKAFMSPQFERQSAHPSAHLPLGVLIFCAGDILHGAAKTQNPHAFVDKDIVFDTDAALGRIFFVAGVVVSLHIEERDIAEGHEKTQILLRQIAAGDDEIDIFHPFGIIIVI